MGKIDRGRTLEFIDALTEVLGALSILDLRGYEREAVETAMELGVTVYDASYVVLARRHGLALVTEDKNLKRRAASLVRVVSLDEIIEG